MSLPSVDSLFIEAVAAGLQGRRVRWEPLPPETWKALFPLAQSQKLLPLPAEYEVDSPTARQDVRSFLEALRKLEILQRKEKTGEKTGNGPGPFPVFSPLTGQGL